MSNQVIPAVEAFWTQNKIIIESPLTGTTGSALRAKLGNNFNKKEIIVQLNESQSSPSKSKEKTIFSFT